VATRCAVTKQAAAGGRCRRRRGGSRRSPVWRAPLGPPAGLREGILAAAAGGNPARGRLDLDLRLSGRGGAGAAVQADWWRRSVAQRIWGRRTAGGGGAWAAAPGLAAPGGGGGAARSRGASPQS
jgi:hypothetical protein